MQGRKKECVQEKGEKKSMQRRCTQGKYMSVCGRGMGRGCRIAGREGGKKCTGSAFHFGDFDKSTTSSASV